MNDVKLDLDFLKFKFGLHPAMSIFSNRGFHSLLIYRISNWLYRRRIPFIPLLLTRLIQIFYSIDIDYRATIKGGVSIVHGVGTVIGEGAYINDGCIIYHQVTIGIKGSANNDGFATVGKNCVLGAGAKLLGHISIGSNSIVGANAVVTKSIPENSVVKLSALVTVSPRS